MASCLNGVARVYSPHYRQTTLSAWHFLDGFDKRLQKWQESWDEGYADIRQAFQAYLRLWHEGRPIYILAHSLGARMAVMLLREFFDDPESPVRRCLVGAYTPGISLLPEMMPRTIPLSSGPGEVGCLAHWMTATQEATWSQICGSGDTRSAGVGTNPLTWRSSAETAGSGDACTDGSLFHGSLGANIRLQPVVYTDIVRGAHLRDGLLRVLNSNENVMRAHGWTLNTRNDLHNGDLFMWWGNIRHNAMLQLEAWEAMRSGQ
eukprot:gnl/MRDRNA2_/MRDRNA2_214324_c0_seq1.p1 gnl/MRDRNA2_/MRDRNA2_214324_c0~~gnl/MRDRNA2_/MRDRNA2_214324_c0_seq1.p1  ORF type:complete len:280 (-),score=25.06 gnl/MRDRNA2_/MRDRNA2_214324_c0_seq1:96-881(-)